MLRVFLVELKKSDDLNLRRNLHLTANKNGLFITDIQRGTLFENLDLKENDKILAVNGELIGDGFTAKKAQQFIEDASECRILVERFGNLPGTSSSRGQHRERSQTSPAAAWTSASNVRESRENSVRSTGSQRTPTSTPEMGRNSEVTVRIGEESRNESGNWAFDLSENLEIQNVSSPSCPLQNGDKLISLNNLKLTNTLSAIDILLLMSSRVNNELVVKRRASASVPRQQSLRPLTLNLESTSSIVPHPPSAGRTPRNERSPDRMRSVSSTLPSSSFVGIRDVDTETDLESLKSIPVGRKGLNHLHMSRSASNVYWGMELENKRDKPGIRICRINDGSPAMQAGLKVGDLIKAVDSNEIGLEAKPFDVNSILYRKLDYRITVWRDS